MRIKSPSLAKRLAASLDDVYLVFGSEPLLVEEACDAIRTQARAQGFEERLTFTIAPGLDDWDTVRAETGAMSLFASRRLIAIRIPSGAGPAHEIQF